MQVPFFRPSIRNEEIGEVVDTLTSGWLTTGPRTKRFEKEFAAAVGASHAVAVNSCTAALHLALEALGLGAGERVIVPTMTFAATAEVVRYLGAEPVLVDCDPETLCMDLDALEMAIRESPHGPAGVPLAGVIPVHVGGMLLDVGRVRELAALHGMWVVEDAAHAFPAAWRASAGDPWERCGAGGSAAICFSFYANKTITTGEGGMAVTADAELAERMRVMSLHGISKDAWKRYTDAGSPHYEIIAPGFKYNMPDIAAAIGIHQLARAETMRLERAAIARHYRERLAPSDAIDLPPESSDRVHAWHLFYLRLRLDRLTIGRDAFIDELAKRRIGCAVHWMPLHLHPYYRGTYGYRAEDFPVATAVWQRLVSLPIFPGMRPEEVDYVATAVLDVCDSHRR